MPEYKTPMRDMQFVLHEMINVEALYTDCGIEDIDAETVNQIMEANAQFCEGKVVPLREAGEHPGVKLEDGVVTMPPGCKEAYAEYVDNGWPSITSTPEYGGQGLPDTLGICLHEILLGANLGWSLVDTLTQSAIRAVEAHASEELKQLYLTKLIEGSWTGTMCLTESHAGTDLGMIRTKATPNGDGSYAIEGGKIFISYGEHDMSENIIHLVLAKLPDAPNGVKGISLFIVPKFLPNADGTPGERNQAFCTALEKKMGLKLSPTCVMNFDGATGWLVGEPHAGMGCMFTMMNHARLNVGIEGLASAELSYQGALQYASERLQMRSPTGAKNPDKPADPIIVHPDVRRMLLTQKSIAEGGRAMVYYQAAQMDVAHHHADEAARKAAEDRIQFLTPIIKSWCTDHGYEAANHGIQVYGGHGFISEWGMEQIARDTRITMLYEGTNGIQALDLIGRKFARNGGAYLWSFLDEVEAHCQEGVVEFTQPLRAKTAEWRSVAEGLLGRFKDEPELANGAAVDFLNYSGYITVAYFWSLMAQKAQAALDAGTNEPAFYQAKLSTARFYFDRMLPRTESLKTCVEAGSGSLMELDAEHFAF